VTDWLKPGSVPPQSASEDLLDDDEVVRDEMAPEPAPAASGGYGTPSDRASPGDSGEGTDETSNAGDDLQTDWLRDAPGGGGQR
jgi:hypothetical protein